MSASKKNRLINMKDNKILLLSGLAALAVSVMIFWLNPSDQKPDGTRLTGIALPVPHQTSTPGSMPPEMMETRINGLIRRVGDATDRVTSGPQDTTVIDPASTIEPAERQVMAEAALVMESLPPPAAGQTGNDSTVAKAPGQGSDGITTNHQDTTVIAAPASIEPQIPVKPDRMSSEPPASPSSEHPAVSGDKNAPWVINLVSTTSKTDADRFAAKARSRNIQTVQQQITVKGTQFWRVQIAGFSTKEDANAYADTAREKLSLKDVWVMKR